MDSITTFPIKVATSFSSCLAKHQLCQLPNGILALIISDTSSKFASCCLTMATGSNADPDDIPGLAHLLEHVLLRGGEKRQRQLSELISSLAGVINASTTGEQTSFYWQVPMDNNSSNDAILDQLMRRMSQIFNKTPSFSNKLIQKEINLVNNEHLINTNSANKILYHGAKLLANEKHPFHRFATGDNLTLKNSKRNNLKLELLKFFKREYTPNKTTLVLKGPQSIQHLLKLVSTHFANWKKKGNRQIVQNVSDFAILAHSWHDRYGDIPIYLRQNSPTCLLIKKPQSITTDQIRINFPIHFDPTGQHLQILLFARAWCHMFGDETRGSICEFLRQKFFITSLSAFVLNLSVGDLTLTLELVLTNEGRLQILQILQYIFSYTNQVCDNVEQLSHFLSELSDIDKLNHLYQHQFDSPMDETHRYLKYLQQHLDTIGPEWCLKGSPIWDGLKRVSKESKEESWWHEQGLRFNQFIKRFITPDNFNLIFLSDAIAIDNFEHQQQFEKDCHYNFEYKRCGIDILKLQYLPKIDNLHIPLPNAFLPPSSITRNPSQVAEMALSYLNTCDSKPLMLLKGQPFETWVKRETNHHYTSKCYITLEISTSIPPSPFNTICLEMLSQLVMLSVQVELYAAEIINYTWEICPCRNSNCNLTITLSGFTDGIGHILETLLKSLTLSFDINFFNRAKIELIHKLELLKDENGIVLGTLQLFSLLEDKMWDYDLRRSTLDQLSWDQFTNFITIFLSQFNLKCLYHGDVSTMHINNYNKLISTILPNFTNVLKLQQSSTFKLSSAKSYYYESSYSPSNDPTNTIVTFIQTGLRDNAYDRTMTTLCAYLMSLTLVQKLRGKRQLGYAIVGGERILRKTVGLHIGITSVEYTPSALNDEIDDYLNEWYDAMMTMPMSKFEQKLDKFRHHYLATANQGNLSMMMSKSLVSSTNIDESSQSYCDHKLLWEHIESTDDDKIDWQIIEQMTHGQFLKFFKGRIESSKRSKISIYLNTKLSKQQVSMYFILPKLQFLLNHYNLPISEDNLKQIIKASNFEQSTIMKNLFKYFIMNGSSFKITTLIFVQILQNSSSLSSKRASRNSSGMTNCKIDNIAQFQNEMVSLV